MNHDMIAAGHPPLRFDMRLYYANLPPHWSTNSESSVTSTIQRHNAGRWRVLQAAAELSDARRLASRESMATPWPELADYDCFACHRPLQLPNDRRPSSGWARWNPWFLAGLDLPPAVRSLVGYNRAVTTVGLPGFANSRTSPTSVPDPVWQRTRRTPVRNWSIFATNGSRREWYDAAVWYLGVRAACQDLPPNARRMDQLTKVLDRAACATLQLETSDRPGHSPVALDSAVMRDLANQLQRIMNSDRDQDEP